MGSDAAPGDGDDPDDRPDLDAVLQATLSYSRERGYVGWDYWDGTSSRLLRALPVENRWLTLAVQEGIKRAPVNLRPLCFVEQRPSPKGLSLFALANAAARDRTGDERYRTETRHLLDRVVDHDLEEYDGFCLYHNHELQGLSEKTPVGTPGVVATAYGVKALLAGSRWDRSYAERARTAADYVENYLSPERTDGGGIRVGYRPTDDGESYTLNANALAARLHTDLYAAFGDERFRETAEGLLTYVAGQQQEAGGWMYRDPPSASHLSMDSYHNGFVVESLLRYRSVVDPEAFTETTRDGLSFYRDVLFEADGAPNWDESRRFPRDVHAAAQGIVTFALAGDTAFARRIAEWTVDELYAGDGQFYYQQRSFYTKQFTLMRWCQAWMAYALATLLRCEDGIDPPEESARDQVPSSTSRSKSRRS